MNAVNAHRRRRGRPARLGLMLICYTIVNISYANADGVLPLSREESLIAMFQTMCLIEPPDAAHLEARAIGMGLKPLADRTETARDGAVTRSNKWGGELKTGAYELRVEQSQRSDGPVTTCAIAGHVMSVSTFNSDAVSMLRLNEAEPRPGRFTWGDVPIPWSGPATTIALDATGVTDTMGGVVELSVSDKVGPASHR
jgi:hypothetical protein